MKQNSISKQRLQEVIERFSGDGLMGEEARAVKQGGFNRGCRCQKNELRNFSNGFRIGAVEVRRELEKLLDEG